MKDFEKLAAEGMKKGKGRHNLTSSDYLEIIHFMKDKKTFTAEDIYKVSTTLYYAGLYEGYKQGKAEEKKKHQPQS